MFVKEQKFKKTSNKTEIEYSKTLDKHYLTNIIY